MQTLSAPRTSRETPHATQNIKQFHLRREYGPETVAKTATDRVKKAMKYPVDSANRFEALEDVESMEDEDLFTPSRSPSSRGCSPIKYPK